jgi:hypothetical protein
MVIFRRRQLSKMPHLRCYNSILGPVAQLVEQRIENPRVGSSILPQATTFNKLEQALT